LVSRPSEQVSAPVVGCSERRKSMTVRRSIALAALMIMSAGRIAGGSDDDTVGEGPRPGTSR
jgi:hypothetical protein